MGQMSTQERLLYMANQIAANFAVAGHDAAVAATADHIASFWDPRMKTRILAHLRPSDVRLNVALDPIARAAIELLAVRGTPAARTAATRFAAVDEVGGSDAG